MLTNMAHSSEKSFESSGLHAQVALSQEHFVSRYTLVHSLIGGLERWEKCASTC